MFCITNILSFGSFLIALKVDIGVTQYVACVYARNIPLIKYTYLGSGVSINQNISFFNELLIDQAATTTLTCFLWTDKQMTRIIANILIYGSTYATLTHCLFVPNVHISY